MLEQKVVPDSAVSNDVPEIETFASAYSAAAHLEGVKDDEEFERIWQASLVRFGDPDVIWQEKPRRLSRAQRHEEAIELIESRDFGHETARERQLLKADLLHAARAHEKCYAIFDKLVTRFPDDQDLRLTYAKRLMNYGLLVKCRRVLGPVEHTFAPTTQAAKVSQQTKALMSLLVAKEGRPLGEDEDGRILAMKHAILHFKERQLRPNLTRGLGKVALITGSLGPGGAERQITRLSVELDKARKAGRTVGGVEIATEVDLVVRSHGPERRNDFFLPDVVANNVPIYELNKIKPVAAKILGVTDPELLTLLTYLPPSVNYGVKRLATFLQKQRTDCASAWQDGACLFTGLAALIAGVPQIQLVMRGLPPSVRRHLFRPEYEVFYKTMAQIPGVHFLSNSAAAADVYADWIEIPRERFQIFYNGVEAMSPEGDEEAEAMFREFDARTSDAKHTIGGVFRFETDKQPNVWVRGAARYYKQHPDARFIAVGGGRLFEKSKKLAEDLGVAHRILFTDRSSKVGYWMTKMDILHLLSRYEGLPNVLIEAQYMGLRVVSTPAGGADECIISGKTGYVLSCNEKPDVKELVRYTNELLEMPGQAELFAEGGEGRMFLDKNFSVPKMLADFTTLTVDRAIPSLDERGALRGKAAA